MPEHFLNIGERDVWGGDQPFGLNAADRRHHLYIVGKTGTGKTTLLRNLVIQDILAGRGMALIDPHGDFAEDLLNCIPRWRTDHVAYFNPTDYDFPVGLNLLARVPADERHRVASAIVGIFKSIWRDSWGPRTEYILYAAVAALLDVEGTTLLGVQRMLVDDAYRSWVVDQVRDPVVRSFWRDEFAHYETRFRREAVAPILNKVGQLLMAAPVRNILGQVRARLDLSFTMDNRRIFIANLSKGRLGEDKANLLGTALVHQFQVAALARASKPEEEREDFHLYIDEFHSFSTDSFASILSESRKYRLCLTVAHQYAAQLRPEVRDAVFGNVGTMIAFRVGYPDASALAKEYGDPFAPTHFTGLEDHQVLIRPRGAGQPFVASPPPPEDFQAKRRDTIIRRSRERFSAPRTVVEDKINRWMSRRF